MIFNKRKAEKIIFYNGHNKQEVIDFWGNKNYGKFLKIIDNELYYKVNDYEPQYKKPIPKNRYITFEYNEDDWWYCSTITTDEYEQNYIYIEEDTVAKKLHESYQVQEQVEDTIYDAFEKYEPKIYKDLDISITSDFYDNSIEIYIKNYIPYPYEPSWDVRDEIYALGFGCVYWNFIDKNGEEFTDEIRGTEPRRLKNAPERSDAEWCKEFYEKYGIGGTDKRFHPSWFDKYQKKNKYND